MVSRRGRAILLAFPSLNLVLGVWVADQEWCQESLFVDRRTDGRLTDEFYFSISNKPTRCLFLDASTILGDGSRVLGVYWFSEAGEN